MSSRTICSSAPFAVKNIFQGWALESAPLSCPLVIKQEFYSTDPNSQFTLNEWECNVETNVFYKKLLVNKHQKGTNVVYSINESELAAAAELDISYFSDSRDALESFLLDQGISGKVLEFEALQQTL